MALVSQLIRVPAELKAAAEAAAAAGGLAASEWIRRAIVAALPGASPRDALARRDTELPPSGGAERRVTLRVPAQELARWETEALAHGLNLTRYVRLQMSVTPDKSRRVAEAVNTLSSASVEMARVGRNLNQIARSWNTWPGQSTAIQRETLMTTCKAVDTFADQITDVCGELNQKLGRRRRKSAVDASGAPLS